MKTTKIAAYALAAVFNVAWAGIWFNDSYRQQPRRLDFPSECLGVKVSKAVGGGAGGDLLGAVVSAGSYVAGAPGMLVGNLSGEFAYSIKNMRGDYSKDPSPFICDEPQPLGPDPRGASMRDLRHSMNR